MCSSALLFDNVQDENPEYSVVKALKVRDGSPLDVPMALFGWDKALDMHVYRGERSKEDKDKNVRATSSMLSYVMLFALQHVFLTNSSVRF